MVKQEGFRVVVRDRRKDRFFLYLNIAMILIFLAGVFIGYQIKESLINDEKVVGFYYNNISFDKLDNYIDKNNFTGDWICVNVEDYTYSEAMEICRHEVAHYMYRHEVPVDDYNRYDDEKFAQYCENIIPNNYFSDEEFPTIREKSDEVYSTRFSSSLFMINDMKGGITK